VGTNAVSLFKQDVAAEYNIEAMPTFLYIKEGKVVDTVVGANKNGLHEKVLKHGTLPAVATSSA
jgi:thioredoxin 1